MAKKYPRLNGAAKISQEYKKINEIAANAEELDGRVDTIIAGGSEDKDPEVVDIRTPDPSYTPLDPITTAGGMTRDMQAQLVAHKQETVTEFEQRGINIMSFAHLANPDNWQPAIQAALDLAKTIPRITKVIVPNGVYPIKDRMHVYHGTHIVAVGATFIRKHLAGFFINGDIGDQFNGYAGNGDITIEGAVLEGNLEEFNNHFNAIGLARGINITLRNLTIKNVYGAHAIDMNACKDVLIENCRFLGYNDDGGNSDFREAIQVAEHTAGGFDSIGVWDGTPCLNVTIRDCYFGASETQPPYPTGVGNHYSVLNKHNSNIVIENNVFEGMSYAGIRPFVYRNVYISNNTFIGCVRGIQLSSTTGTGEGQEGIPQANGDITIEGNVFKDISADGIYGVGREFEGNVARVETAIVKDNIFENVSTCMHLKFANNLIINNNVAKNCGRFLEGSYISNAYLAGNKAQNLLNEMVFFEGPDAGYSENSKNITVVGNQVKVSGRHTVFLQYTENFSVIDNILESPAVETDNSRNGINIAAYCANGIIAKNRVIKAISGNQNKFGIEITGTCQNIQVFNNDVEGKTGRVSIPTTNGNFDGMYLHSPNGTRYKMTIGNDGTPVFDVG